jgi:hypothetical protein
MAYSQQAHIDNIVANIRARIQAERSGDKLAKDAVEAIDIVHHGLVFSRHRDGMALWRRALWDRQLDPEAEVSLRDMLEYLLAAVARGDFQAVSNICDCLNDIMPPKEAFETAAASV